MKQVVRGVFALLLAALAAQARDGPKDKPPTPRVRYDALVKEFEDWQLAQGNAWRAARTPEQHEKLERKWATRQEKFFARLVELAEKNPKDPVAVDALLRVAVENPAHRGGPPGGPSRKKALRLLARDHAGSEKLGDLPQVIRWDYEAENETLLRAILNKNPSKGVQAEACVALVENLSQRAMLARRMPSNAELARRIEYLAGKETAADLRKGDPDKLETEGEKVARLFGDKYLGELPPKRLVKVCDARGFYADKGSEALVRALLKHENRRVQGVACLGVGQVLKRRADEVAARDGSQAARLRREAGKLFRRAAEEYANVKKAYEGTVGQQAKRELYEVRHLVVGKPAPEVEGEDQDGKKFKLSDYKGKVVLLDFWTQT